MKHRVTKPYLYNLYIVFIVHFNENMLLNQSILRFFFVNYYQEILHLFQDVRVTLIPVVWVFIYLLAIQFFPTYVQPRCSCVNHFFTCQEQLLTSIETHICTSGLVEHLSNQSMNTPDSSKE